MLPNALWKARRVGCELQVRPVFIDQLGKIPDAQKPSRFRDNRVDSAKFILYDGFQLFRHAGFNFKANHPAPPPALDGTTEISNQIFGFFFDFDIAVPDDPERTSTQNFIAWEKKPSETPQKRLHRHIASFSARYPDETRQG